MKALVKSSAFSLLSNIFQLIVSLGSGIIVARNLGTEGKGEVFLVTQVYTLVQVLFSFGFGPAIVFYLKKKEIGLAEINSFIWKYLLALSALFIIVLFLFKSPIKSLIGGDLSLVLLVFTFLIAYVNIVASFIGYKIMSEEGGVEYWSYTVLIGNAIYLATLAVFIFILKLGVIGVAYSLLISAICKVVLLLITKYSNFTTNNISKANFIKLSTYGLQVFLINLFLTSVFRIDTFILNRFVSIEKLGLYSVAVNVGELLLLIPSAIGVALFPHLSGLAKNEQIQAMCLFGRISFLIGLTGIVALSIIGYPFIRIVFGVDFLPAFIPFLYLLPGLMAMTLNYSYSNYFSSIGKPLIGAYIFFGGLIINLGLNFWLIPNLGISGAAISSSVTYFLITICFVVKIKKIDHLSLREFVFPKKTDFRYINDKIMAFIKKK